jgi:hypothetical protein
VVDGQDMVAAVDVTVRLLPADRGSVRTARDDARYRPVEIL